MVRGGPCGTGCPFEGSRPPPLTPSPDAPVRGRRVHVRHKEPRPRGSGDHGALECILRLRPIHGVGEGGVACAGRMGCYHPTVAPAECTTDGRRGCPLPAISAPTSWAGIWRSCRPRPAAGWSTRGLRRATLAFGVWCWAGPSATSASCRLTGSAARRLSRHLQVGPLVLLAERGAAWPRPAAARRGGAPAAPPPARPSLKAHDRLILCGWLEPWRQADRCSSGRGSLVEVVCRGLVTTGAPLAGSSGQWLSWECWGVGHVDINRLTACVRTTYSRVGEPRRGNSGSRRKRGSLDPQADFGHLVSCRATYQRGEVMRSCLGM